MVGLRFFGSRFAGHFQGVLGWFGGPHAWTLCWISFWNFWELGLHHQQICEGPWHLSVLQRRLKNQCVWRHPRSWGGILYVESVHSIRSLVVPHPMADHVRDTVRPHLQGQLGPWGHSDNITSGGFTNQIFLIFRHFICLILTDFLGYEIFFLVLNYFLFLEDFLSIERFS